MINPYNNRGPESLRSARITREQDRLPDPTPQSEEPTAPEAEGDFPIGYAEPDESCRSCGRRTFRGKPFCKLHDY